MATKERQRGTLPVHRHSYTRGPNATAGYRADGKWHTNQFEHAHEGGDRSHGHPETGPAHFIGGIARAKLVTRPTGEQLPLVALEDEQRTFHVVFVDEYTAAHTSAGISRERWEAERAGFLRCIAGEAHGLHAVSRMIDDFDMTPIYELRRPDDAETRR